MTGGKVQPINPIWSQNFIPNFLNRFILKTTTLFISVLESKMVHNIKTAETYSILSLIQSMSKKKKQSMQTHSILYILRFIMTV